MESFRDFNFDDDERWKEYERNLTIPPGKESLLVKKKAQWYQRCIDDGFDVDAFLAKEMPAQPRATSPAPKHKATPTSTAGQAPSTTQQRPAAAPAASSLLAAFTDVQSLLCVAHIWMIISIVLSLNPFNRYLAQKSFYQALRTATIVHFIRVFRRHGNPFKGFSHLKTYMTQVSGTTEFFYAIASIMVSNNPHMWLVTLAMGILAVYHVSAYLREVGPVHTWLTQHQAQSVSLMALFEILTFFQALTGFFTVGPKALMISWVYLNQLRMRYVNADSRLQHIEIWRELNQRAAPLLAAVPMLNTPVGAATRWFNNLPATEQRAHAE